VVSYIPDPDRWWHFVDRVVLLARHPGAQQVWPRSVDQWRPDQPEHRSLIASSRANR
jgi:hypothetical protein